MTVKHKKIYFITKLNIFRLSRRVSNAWRFSIFLINDVIIYRAHITFERIKAVEVKDKTLFSIKETKNDMIHSMRIRSYISFSYTFFLNSKSLFS